MNAAVQLAARLRTDGLPRAGLIAAYDFARSNFANWSEDLTQSGWVRSATTVALVAGQVLADGSVGAVSKVLDTTANTQHLISTSAFIPSDNAPQSFVWRVKAAEYQYVGAQWSNKALNIYPTNIVDLVTGNILNSTTGSSLGSTITTTSGGLAYTLTVVSAGNGWWDLILNIPSVGAGSSSPRPALLLQNQPTNTNSFTFAGTGTSGILIQRVQWNATLAPLGYEKTTDGQLLLDRNTRLWPAPASRFNALVWTEDFTQSAWIKSGCTLSDPAITDPLTGAKAGRLTATTIDPYIQQNISGNPSGLTVTYSARVKLEGATAGRSFRIYSYGNPGNEALTQAGLVAATGDWQTISFTRTFPAGMTSTSHAWRIDIPENGTQVGDTVLIAAPALNFGPVALPYEVQHDAAPLDNTLKGRNLLLASEDFSSTVIWNRAGVNFNGMTAIVSTSGGATYFYQEINVKPGQVYTFSMLVTAATVPNATVATYDVTNGVFLSTTDLANVGVPFSKTITVPAGCTKLRVYPYRTGSYAGNVTFSNLMLSLGATPAPYERSASHAMLGTSASADSNDPIWTSQGLLFDGVDDIAGQTAFSVPDGDFSFLVALTPLADYGSVDGKTIIRTAPGGAGWWRSSVYYGPGSGSTALKVAVYHATGGFNNSGFTYQNISGVVVGVPTFLIVRVRGLSARSEIRTSGASGMASYSSYAVGIPAPPVGGQFYGFGNTANAVVHAAAFWNRHLSDAEAMQAYRAVRNQLSKRGVAI